MIMMQMQMQMQMEVGASIIGTATQSRDAPSISS
jgi:hypothetical protein